MLRVGLLLVAERLLYYPMIKVENLTKHFGATKAIDNISFSVKEGSVAGFLGPNGAGKSTTMRILAGIHLATSGFASINGVSVAASPEVTKTLVGYLPENNPLPGEMSVGEYLRFRAKLKGLSGKVLSERVQEVMDLCDLSRKAKGSLISTLSKGFKQRVGIADTLLAEPKLIILDEPTIGLDPHQVLSIRSLIKNLKGWVTFLISSHILPELELICDDIVIINKGVIVASGTRETLKREYFSKAKFELKLSTSLSYLKELLSKKQKCNFEVLSLGEEEGLVVATLSAQTPKLISEEILSPVIASGGWVHSLSEQETTLEDIFIAATHKSENDIKNLKSKNENMLSVN